MTCSPKHTGTPSETAAALIADRGKVYGAPAKNFQRIADLWNAILSDRFADEVDQLTALDVAQMFRLAKESRLAETPGHFDSLADICAYADLQMEVWGAAPAPTPAKRTAYTVPAETLISNGEDVDWNRPPILKQAPSKMALAEQGILDKNEVALLPGSRVHLNDVPGVWEIKEYIATHFYRVEKVGSVLTKLIHDSEIKGVVKP